MTQDEERVAFTMKQIRAIYDAGVRRGSDEATAFAHGASASGPDDGNLADALHDIANEGLAFGDPLYVTYGNTETMFQQLATPKDPHPCK